MKNSFFMNEKLLQYIWEHQYYNSRNLELSDGSTLKVIHPGHYNSHQGPDFLEGKCRIDETTFVGHIELHIRASDWNRHLHQFDPNYDNVILHVVLYNDQPSNLRQLPTLILEDRVPQVLLARYNSLMNSRAAIPCEKNFLGVSEPTWVSLKKKVLTERLNRKGSQIEEYLKINNHHWEECFWWLLSKIFGSKINAEAFEAMAKSIPFNVIARHRTQLIHLEAMLLGQSNLLSKDFEESYPRMLQKEYRFLQKKYRLVPIHERLCFLRMRPVNFPTVRLAQLAMLYHQCGQVFTVVSEAEDLNAIRPIFDVTANDYWHYHYLPDSLSGYRPKRIGKTMSDNIIINAVIPMVYWQGKYSNNKKQMDKAHVWLEQMSAEQNSLITNFKRIGFPAISASDSQAILELKQHWCDQRNCLRCAIGQAILKRDDLPLSPGNIALSS